MNILDVSVSKYKNAQDSTTYEEVNLYRFLVQPDQNVIERIVALRTSEPEGTKALKKTLPAITPSGLFTKRNANGLIKHSGLICLDIDFKDNLHIENYNDIKQQICKIKNVAYCGLSVSGKGYMVLIPIAYPEKHKAHFYALEDLFLQWNIKVDKACKDVCRLRFASYDPQAYINPHAVLFSKVLDEKQEKPKSQLHKASGADVSRFNRCLTQILKTGTDITGDYYQWGQIAFALCNKFGEEGLEYFQMISQFHPNYISMEAERRYIGCLNSKGTGITIGSFFHICKEYGIK